MKRTLITLTSFLVAIIAYLAYEYFGLLEVIPIICIAISYWIINRYADKNKKPMFPALSLISGHIVWSFTGIFILLLFFISSDVVKKLPYNPLSGLIDVGVMTILFLWLFLRTGLASGICNILFSIVEAGVNIFYILHITVDSDLTKGYILHLIIFVCTTIALIVGLISIKKSKVRKSNNPFSAPSSIDP